MAKILLTGINHLKIPNHPRHSKHTLIHVKDFPAGRLPLSSIWKPLEGLAAWQPVWGGYQLIHCFNTIPFTHKPWICTFEDRLPRLPDYSFRGKSFLQKFLRERLVMKNCRKLIAISEYAKIKLASLLQDWSLLNQVLEKVEVIHPNFPTLATHPKVYRNNQPLQLLFVGNHVARKGGIVALRLAKQLEKIGLPIQIHLVSQLKCGKTVPTDFPDRTKYEEDLKLINLPNVVLHGQIPNKQVLQLMSQSHFLLLPTLHDTYGYSVLEGFSNATPAITTNVCALPEIVRHEQNGYSLNLVLSQTRQWADWVNYGNNEDYWYVLNNTYNSLMEQALHLLISFFNKPDRQDYYEALSAGALNQAKIMHDSYNASDRLDQLYSTILETAQE